LNPDKIFFARRFYLNCAE
jgi:hypothetical protein